MVVKKMTSKSICIKYMKKVSLDITAKPPHDKKSLTIPENYEENFYHYTLFSS